MDLEGQIHTLSRRLEENQNLAISLDRRMRGLVRQQHEPDAARQRFVRHAVLRMFGEDADPADVWRQRYGAKGASSPALVSVPEWAGVLSAEDVMGFLLGGQSPSLLARLLTYGMNIGNDWTLKVPYRSDSDFCGDWIVEGEPAPVEAISLASIMPIIRKVVSLSTFSRDLRKHSNPQIERLLDGMLRRDINGIVDKALVDDQPSSIKRPAGLLNGVTTTPGTGSLLGDLQALAGAVMDNGGSGVVFMTGPVTALGFAALPGAVPYTVLDSPHIAPNRVIAIDPQGFVGSLSGAVIDTTEAAVVHEENSAPAPIVDGAGVVAKPVRSLWQTATVGMRCALDAGWAARNVQYTDGTMP
ncbi:hypothetical protein [Phyllobacterium pellucidum]|uniref:hypothetical protein n=1 Tax=Phyllobacterium pellucidum TaxID=2740464 RepID=UPI001D14695F|nr:hypothetical protein [Phyllobacterium sp. T1018]UGY08649.1 hypothetical protein LLE51_011430 [Phyllobacterium sp. T1018]